MADVVPQLARPWWVWLIGLAIVEQRGRQTARAAPVLSVSPEAVAHAERKRRSRKARPSRAVVRPGRRGVAGLLRAVAATPVATQTGPQ